MAPIAEKQKKKKNKIKTESSNCVEVKVHTNTNKNGTHNKDAGQERRMEGRLEEEEGEKHALVQK